MAFDISNSFKMFTFSDSKYSQEAYNENSEQNNIKSLFSTEAEEDDEESFVDAAEEKLDPEGSEDDSTDDDFSSDGDDFGDTDDFGGGDDTGDGEDDFGDGDSEGGDMDSGSEGNNKKPNITGNPLSVMNGRKLLLEEMDRLRSLVDLSIDKLVESELRETVEFNELEELSKMIDEDKSMFHLISNDECSLRLQIFGKQLESILSNLEKKQNNNN